MIKEYFTHIISEIPEIVISCILYFAGTIFYILKVTEFNDKYGQEKNFITVMTVENGIAWYYFAFAILFFMIGVFLIVFCLKSMKGNVEGYSILTTIIFTILIIAIMVTIIIVINNPILKCALAVLGIATLITTSK